MDDIWGAAVGGGVSSTLPQPKSRRSDMPSGRPKLLIQGGLSSLPEGAAEVLREAFDLVEPGEESGGADLVLALGASSEAVDRAGNGDGLSGAGGEPPTALLDAIGESICLAEGTGEAVWSNARFRALDAEIADKVREVTIEAARFFASSAGRGGGRSQCRFDLEHSNGSAFYEVDVAPATGQPGRLAVTVRNVTKRVLVERKMNAIDRAGAALVGLEAEAIRTRNAAERLELVEERITRFTRDLLHFDHFIVRLLDRQTGKLEPVIMAGMPPEATDLDLFAEPEGNGITGWVAATGTSYLCADAEADERYLPGLTAARSSLTVPLRLHDEVIGVMNVESLSPAAFTESDRQFAEIFARYIAIALHTLNLLVVERSQVNESVSGRVEGELRECLEDIISETEWLSESGSDDPDSATHVERIKRDVQDIRERLRNVASGPQTLLGVDRALAEKTTDPALVGRRVLVVDDAAKVRRIIRDVLVNRGASVTVCEHGGEAVRVLQGCAEGAPGYDLIISDINMPDRNGYEVFSAARKALPRVSVILMTGFGYDPHHSIVRASQEGLQCVLFKPFPIERLMQEVRKALTASAG